MWYSTQFMVSRVRMNKREKIKQFCNIFIFSVCFFFLIVQLSQCCNKYLTGDNIVTSISSTKFDREGTRPAITFCGWMLRLEQNYEPGDYTFTTVNNVRKVWTCPRKIGPKDSLLNLARTNYSDHLKLGHLCI